MPNPAAPPLTRAVVLRGLGLTLAVALGAVAVWLIVTGSSTKSVRLGALAGAWGLLIGAYAMFGSRRLGAEPLRGNHVGGAEVALRSPGGVERTDDAAARADFEKRLEQLLRSEINKSMSHEVEELRNEIAQLRADLLEKVGGQLRLERIETTRLIGSDLEALQHEVRQLKVARDDSPLSPSVRAQPGDQHRVRSVRQVVETASASPIPPVAVAPVAGVADVETPERAPQPTPGDAVHPAQESAPSPSPSDKAPAETERAERVRAEHERAARERAERARVERQRAETARLERERAERARAERERVERERVERERVRAERQQAEKVRRDAEQAKAEASRAAAARAAAEKARAEQVRAEAEKAAAEQVRAEQTRAEQTRAEQTRAEQARAEQARAEQARADQPEPATGRAASQSTSGASADPFASLPRITPFTEFELDPVEAQPPAAPAPAVAEQAPPRRRNGHAAPDTEPAADTATDAAADDRAAIDYTGRRRSQAEADAAAQVQADSERPGRHGARQERRRRRADESSDGMDLLAQLLARESAER